mgnify:CR=1 FL=1
MFQALLAVISTVVTQNRRFFKRFEFFDHTAAIAGAFATEGANIVVNVRSSLAEGEAVVKDVRAARRKCILIVADVTDSHQVGKMAKRAAEEIGPIDILVNSVGVAPMAKLKDTTDERWDQVLKTACT